MRPHISIVIAAATAALVFSPRSYGATVPRVPADIGPRPGGACVAGGETVALRPTGNAPGSEGTVTLDLPDSPFGVTVDLEGRQAYELVIQVERMRRRRGATYVVWAATPELDEHARLGVLGEDNRVVASLSWNKFLVFVSEETSPDVERWEGPILLTALSPSGRMHTMAGHGPFEFMNCADYGW
jgi:hypothetical protein